MDFYIPVSEASLKSFDETRLLKIHQKIQFWLYCTCGAAGRQEAGEAGVHFPPKVREHTWWDTAHRHPSPPRRDAGRPTCDCPCSLAIFGPRSCSSATHGKNGELKNLNLSDSLWNLLSNFQNNHSKTKEKSAFLKHAFLWCPPENHREGEKGSECHQYSRILSSLLTWCVSQQPLKCTYLTPPLHFKAPPSMASDHLCGQSYIRSRLGLQSYANFFFLFHCFPSFLWSAQEHGIPFFSLCVQQKKKKKHISSHTN